MTKAKAQLRAEAVERLRNCTDWAWSDLADFFKASGLMDDPYHTPYVELRAALIDLLTDEEPRKFGVTAEQMAKASADYFDKLPRVNGKKADSLPTTAEDEDANCKNDDSLQDSREKLKAADRVLSLLTGKERVFADDESHDDEHDTREKLDEDVWRYFHIEWNRDYHVFDDVCNDVKAWLDRQAAITRMEDERACHDCTIEQVEALQEQVDELEKECNYWKLHTDLWADKCKELEAKVGKLEVKLENAYAKNRSLRLHISKMQSGRNGWHVKAKQLEAENEQLREKLSRAYDNAHDTLKVLRGDAQ